MAKGKGQRGNSPDFSRDAYALPAVGLLLRGEPRGLTCLHWEYLPYTVYRRQQAETSHPDRGPEDYSVVDPQVQGAPTVLDA